MKRSFVLPLVCSLVAIGLLTSCFIAAESVTRNRFGGTAKFVDGIGAEVKGSPSYTRWDAQSRLIRFTEYPNKTYDYINQVKLRIKRNNVDIVPANCGHTPQGGECAVVMLTESTDGCYYYMNSWVERKAKDPGAVWPSYSHEGYDVLKPGSACANQE
jgi:hypothetical protein